jgi:hypothetical protein
MQIQRRNIFKSLVALPITIATFAKEALGESRGADFERQSLAVNLLRFVNTSQWKFRKDTQRYAGLSELVASESMVAIRQKYGKQKQIGPIMEMFTLESNQAVPGWLLDFKISDDGLSYVAVARDATGTAVGTFATDQEGVIYQTQSDLASPLKEGIWSAKLAIPDPAPLRGDKSKNQLVAFFFMCCDFWDCCGCCHCSQFEYCCDLCCGGCLLGNNCLAIPCCCCCANTGCDDCSWCCMNCC